MWSDWFKLVNGFVLCGISGIMPCCYDQRDPMHFRLANNLAVKVKVKPEPCLPLADDPLIDFSSNLFRFDRSQYILVSHTTTLFSAIIPARGLTSGHVLAISSLTAISEVLEHVGLLELYQSKLSPGSRVVRFGKALNRSVTGSMNELIVRATHKMSPETPLFEVGIFINKLLLSMLKNDDGRQYGRPTEAMRRLLQA